MKRLALLSPLFAALLLAGLYPVLSQATTEVGYTVLENAEGEGTPIGAALFSFTNEQGILVWEAAIAASEPISSGRIFVDQSNLTRTAVAFANTSDQLVESTLILRDELGLEVDRRMEPFEAGEQRALFVDELFGGVPDSFAGSLTFKTASRDQELAAVTLRQNENPYGEAVLATLPVARLEQELLPSATEAPNPTSIDSEFVFPHVGAGRGLSTLLILLNTSPEPVGGTVRLTASDGTAWEVEVGGVLVSGFPFQMEGDGVFRCELTSSEEVRLGYATVSVDEGSQPPAGAAIFQFRRGDRVVSEAGVEAVAATTKARLFVDQHRTRTGVAVASTSNQANRLRFRLLDRFGQFLAQREEEVPAGGHRSLFADELFNRIPDGFTGLLELESEWPVFPLSLKLTINERGDPILTTLPVADLTRPIQAERLVFAQFGFGGGFSTRLILINADQANPASGSLQFFGSGGGEELALQLGDRFGSRFDYELSSGGIIQYRPGNTARVERLLLDTFNPEFSEVVVNQGNRFRLRPRVIDGDGNPRDDFGLSYLSLDQEVARIDERGVIEGIEKGFSTLTISAGDLQLKGMITVVEVTSGPDVGETTGVVQDSAGRIYLSSESNHVIWRANSIQSPPAIFAGAFGSPGFENGNRQQSRFNRPSYMALNQATGELYVSDSGNHVIRRIKGSGEVETFAGTGQAGSRDGSRERARFSNPQGLALDNRGHLWVADSGNHTIRTIDLLSDEVHTLAGSPGEVGNLDGKGPQARFAVPLGIAVENRFVDSLRGPTPVNMVVADSSNGTIRRVFKDGYVETLDRKNVDPRAARRSRGQTQPPLLFQFPVGVAVDSSGSIFVTESETGQAKVIRGDGSVAAFSQKEGHSSAKGIWAAKSGQAMLSGDSTEEVSYGGPVIDSITPDVLDQRGGEAVTIRGRNFTPDTFLVVGAIVLTDIDTRDTQTIIFKSPYSDSGTRSLSTVTRGGLVQRPLGFRPVPLHALPAGWITTVAGGATFTGEGSEATSAALNAPEGIAVDGAGNLFIADTWSNRIRKVDAATGIITTVAGTGEYDFWGDGGPAPAAAFAGAAGVAVDRAGNLFIADTGNHRIRKVDTVTEIITTVAGTGENVFSGDGGAATAAALHSPEGVTVDGAGNLFIADTGNHRIRKVNAATGIITTVAGTGEEGFSGDGGPTAAAGLAYPRGVAVDMAGNLFIADSNNLRFRRVDAATGIVTTVAGTGETGFSGDGGPATAAAVGGSGVTVDKVGNLFIANSGNHRIRKVDAATGIITTVAGTGDFSFWGDGGPATAAALRQPNGVAVDGAGNLFIADTWSHRIRKVDAATGIIATVAGMGEIALSLGNRLGPPHGDGNLATLAALVDCRSVAVDRKGNLFISDLNRRIRKIDAATGIITTVAGSDEYGFSGDGDLATLAALGDPSRVVVDEEGNLFVADLGNNRIRKVNSATGIISTVAGTGEEGFSGDGGSATAAALSRTTGLALDGAGNLFIASWNHRIRKVDAATGIITTVAGTGEQDYSGDGGPATAATLNFPEGLALDEAGNLFIADSANHRIRKVDAATGIISTVVGGSATAAALNLPYSVAVDSVGNLFITDAGNHRICKMDAVTGIMTTVAGKGVAGFSGDGGPAAVAALDWPIDLTVDRAGNLFIDDSRNNRIRAVHAPIP